MYKVRVLLTWKDPKKVPADSISAVHSEDGVYTVKSSTGSSVYDVNITSGNCSCPYFLQHNIPCKHMFSIFEHTEWSWKNLPLSLTESPHMVLQTSLLKVNQSEPHSVDDDTDCVDILAGNLDTVIVDHKVGDPTNSDTVLSEIPTYHSTGKMLLNMQKKIRDTLAKCSAAVFMIDDISVLLAINDKVSDIHSELLQMASTNLSSEQIPVMKCLMADEANEYKQEIHLIS